MEHSELVQWAREAIERVFSDQSVSRVVTGESLKELAEDIEIRLEAVRSEGG